VDRKTIIGMITILAFVCLISSILFWQEISEKGKNLMPLGNETYKFTWTQEQQDIVQGILVLELTYFQSLDRLHFTVKINDDEFNPHDYLGMTFDKNGNGVIDLGDSDEPYGLWANNMTAPAALTDKGLVFAEVMPKKGPHICKFDSAGYTFEVSFSKSELNLTKNSTLLRICFGDKDVAYGKIGVVCTDDIIIKGQWQQIIKIKNDITRYLAKKGERLYRITYFAKTNGGWYLELYTTKNINTHPYSREPTFYGHIIEISDKGEILKDEVVYTGHEMIIPIPKK